MVNIRSQELNDSNREWILKLLTDPSYSYVLHVATGSVHRIYQVLFESTYVGRLAQVREFEVHEYPNEKDIREFLDKCTRVIVLHELETIFAYEEVSSEVENKNDRI